MTNVYFVRHAEPNYENHDDLTRELTAKGMADRQKVVDYFAGQQIDAMYSSPYKRSIDTIKPLADERNLTIRIVEDFHERKVQSSGWLEDFHAFSKHQWEDFSYKINDGECLSEVQKRNIAALEDVLRENEGKTVVIGSHGTALSTVINYYDPSFGFDDFQQIVGVMPWIVKFTFDGLTCTGIWRDVDDTDNL